MKKALLRAAALCCAAALSACGKAGSDNVTPPDGKLDPCELRFSWWGGDDRHEATLKAIELWEKDHPDIKIRPEYGGWDGWTEKVAAQVAGGVEPDVMQINYDWLITLSPDGKGFYDLEKLSPTLDLSGFSEDVLSFGRVDGILNAAAVSITGRRLFYNSAVYRELGADYPTTWEELVSLGKVFSGKNAYPLDLDVQSGGTAWYLAVVYVQQKTGKTFVDMDGELGFDEEDIKEALDFYKRLEDAGVIRTVRARTDADGVAALYQSPEFISGKVAGVLEWGSSVGKYEAVLPEGALEAGPLLSDGDGNSSGYMIKPSMLYAISKNCERPDEAAAFISFLLNDEECARALGDTRGTPASSYARKALEAPGARIGLAMKSDEELQKAATVTISPYMELPRMKEIYNTAIEEVSYGVCDAETAAREMRDSITAYLRKLKK